MTPSLLISTMPLCTCDLGAHVAQAKVDGAEIEPAAHLGLQQRPAQPRAHVRLALRVGHRVGRDEGEQPGADVAVDVGLDVLGHEPRPQRGAAPELHRRAVDVIARSCTATPP